MSPGKLVMLLVALNPVVFGILAGVLLRRRRLPPPRLRVAATLLYFVATYGALWVALQLVDLRPVVASSAP